MKIAAFSFILAVLLAGVSSSEQEFDYLINDYLQQWNQTVTHLKHGILDRDTLVAELSKLRLPTLPYHLMNQQTEDSLCGVCRASVQTLLSMRRIGASQNALRNLAMSLCTGFNIVPDYVCSGVIDLNIQVLLFIVDSRRQLTAETVCGIILQPLNCNLGSGPNLEWSIDIDETDQTEITEPKHEIPNSSEDDLTIVHITDTHYDPHYREGANAECGVPVCCRYKQGFPALAEHQAGRWGDYRFCDSPWEAILDVFESIKANHKKIDYIYFTGDIVDHGVWETSFAGNIHSIRRTFDGLKSVFGDIPIYPVIANHEPHPTNQFAPAHIIQQSLTTNHLYELMADTWYWLPESSKATIREVGYYTTLIRPGLRVIGMNNNDGYTFNWWLMYDASYATKQLQWLHDTLLAAETNQEHVHILAHIPSGNGDCFRTWSREYNRIVNRFYKTISGQFNGHTHRDQFAIYYAHDKPEYAINVAWNGGSATPYSHVNANYRLYQVESKSYQVVDHETWIFNLTKANLNRDYAPEWFKEYSFKNGYGVDDLSPASLDTLATDMATDHEKLYMYWQHKVKMGDTALASGCDNQCLANELCSITTAEFGSSNVRCEQLQEIFWNHINSIE